jgi:hypothetical protein
VAASIEPPKALLDASALYGPTNRRELQQAAAAGLFAAYWSPWIVEELARNLTTDYYRTRPYSAETRRTLSGLSKRMMAFLIASFAVVDPKPPFPDTWPAADPGDDHVWAAAVAAGVAYVVSENTRHFPPRAESGRHEWNGIVYLTPVEFFALVNP